MSNRIINILTPDVYNKIAAGEVVERPTSAIKELVENSIDAGANRITIEVKNGGYDLISVTDNGGGIFEEDIDAVFLRHATSKLKNADDLNLIQTLGFRGEALASIAAVSRIKMTTRQAQSDTGICVEVEAGNIVSRQHVTANVGTKIEVYDLYYNVPVRRKFMKGGTRETGDINKFVSKLVLTNPNLEITYLADDKKVFQTKGNGVSEAIFAVYGADCLAHCLPVNYEKDFVRICGFVGTPEYSKSNTTYQTLSVNGRNIVDKNIQAAIGQAFKPYLMQRQFPFFVLDLSIPCDKVDVNIHPRKSEVRFVESNHICGCFFHAVDEVLKQYSQQRVKQILDSEETDREQMSFEQSTLFGDLSKMTTHQAADISEIKAAKPTAPMSFDEFADELDRTLSVAAARRALGISVEDGVCQPVAELRIEATRERHVPTPAELMVGRSRILGTAFLTYIIVEIDDKIIFIDQHAAHERILFDNFMQGKSSAMQPLLFPYVFAVKEDEAEFIDANLDNILRAGIEIQPFGLNNYRICAVSSLLADTKLDVFVSYLLEGIEEMRLDDRALIVEKIAKKACKAAVKAGEMLTEMEIKQLLRSMYEGNVLQCPHGRPVTAVFTRKQLEKMFKRIV